MLSADRVLSLEGLSELRSLFLIATDITDAGLASIAKLSKLERLELFVTKATGPGLKHLRGLSELRVLDLTGMRDCGLGLVHVAELKNLTQLSLGSDVTSYHLRHMDPLPKLQVLGLGYNPGIDDECLPGLEKMPALKSVYARGTRIDRVGRWRAALPQATIYPRKACPPLLLDERRLPKQTVFLD